jgi:hypothetical protein
MDEATFAVRLKELGFNLYHSGWPDFIVKSPNGKILFIEHKNVRDKVKANQAEVHGLLGEVGIPVHVVRSIEEVVKLAGMDASNLRGEDLTEANLPEGTIAHSLQETEQPILTIGKCGRVPTVLKGRHLVSSVNGKTEVVIDGVYPNQIILDLSKMPTTKELVVNLPIIKKRKLTETAEQKALNMPSSL